MSHYDLVIGYATDGIYPLLAGKRPYVAYEHGTIRSIPFETNQVGRCCALTYKLADAVVITNCDCDIAADRLQLDNHRFIPHPINEDWLEDQSWLALRNDLRQQLKSDFIIFHPSRQHWEAERHPSWEKGNDFLIRGFARFVHEVCPSAAMVCVAWGKTLQQSKDLLAELGVADRVLWIEPKPTVRMTRYIRASDVVADQFYLGAFGGVMPKAMVYGRPTLIYLNEERHRWCFPEMPPICNTRTGDEVFDSLRRLRTEPNYMQQMVDDGLRWYAKYHSSGLVAQRFDDILGDVLSLHKTSHATQSGDQRRCA
jgi:glycosyltransferase involved in cell wall biosynthesis